MKWLPRTSWWLKELKGGILKSSQPHEPKVSFSQRGYDLWSRYLHASSNEEVLVVCQETINGFTTGLCFCNNLCREVLLLTLKRCMFFQPVKLLSKQSQVQLFFMDNMDIAILWLVACNDSASTPPDTSLNLSTASSCFTIFKFAPATCTTSTLEPKFRFHHLWTWVAHACLFLELLYSCTYVTRYEKRSISAQKFEIVLAVPRESVQRTQ